MGMFDHIHCRVPLPEGYTQYQDRAFQTKDLDCVLDQCEIREDGLWREDYDIEDRSDPNAVGIKRIFGCMTRVNKRWVRVPDYTGTIRFYDGLGEMSSGWIEFEAHIGLGHLLRPVALIKYTPIDDAEEADRAARLRAVFEPPTPEGDPS